ncbi:MAG: MOSC domain-containing protein [Pseudomonadota bacterium]
MHLSRIYRHPIKALGVESLAEVTLTPGARLAGDRLWAVAHEAARLETEGGWAHCSNFIRGAKSAELMAITAVTSPGGLTLSHPKRPDITLNPETDGAALIDWVRPLCDPGRAAPARLVPVADGVTDNAMPWLSLLSHSSRQDLSAVMGRGLSPLRFRGNLWIEGAEPWAESGWIGRRLAIGDTVLEVTEPIDRCSATNVDPETGQADSDLLKALEDHRGNIDFGVFVAVIAGGPIAPGDPVTLL